MKEEQILVRITGQDRPGLTAAVMDILAKCDAYILDIGQADIHNTLSLGILIRMDENLARLYIGSPVRAKRHGVFPRHGQGWKPL